MLENEKCTLCGNRCKVTSLKCKRGKNYYARLEQEQAKNTTSNLNRDKREDR